MPLFIKDGKTTENTWRRFDAEKDAQALLAEGHWILPLAEAKSALDTGLISAGRLGISLKSDDALESLAGLLDSLPLIVLEFEIFTDGRSFSQARTLRDHYEYQGELRASGYFLLDQLFYLKRCGINAFEFQDARDPDDIFTSLKDFPESYQAACDEPQPLFRRRV